MCEQLGLLESGQLSFFGAKMTFLWSRLRSAKDTGVASERKLRNLFFEDFLEALVRIARLIALPTDEELADAGAADAGEYLLAMRADPKLLARFIEQHKMGWQREPRQATSRCVAHLISYIVHTVEESLLAQEQRVAKEDHELTHEEVTRFEKMRRQGLMLSQLKRTTALLDGVQAAHSLARMRRLQALYIIDLFARLDAQDIEELCDAMVEKGFVQGELVFEQGEQGDELFVVSEGAAEVLREEEPGKPPTLLATLSEGQYFGERALIKAQARFATVRATSARLLTMSITGPRLEEVLGRSIETLVPEKYRLDPRELVRRLGEVPLLRRLSARQLETLADRLSESEFKKGEYVVRLPAPCTSFHLVTTGHAEAVKAPDEPGALPVKVGAFEQWSWFGERALLGETVLEASVRAGSAVLKTLSITRAALLAALGEDTVNKRLVDKPPPASPSASGEAAAAEQADKKRSPRRSPTTTRLPRRPSEETSKQS